MLIWGFNWPIMKIAMEEQLIAPFTFALARVAFSSLLMFVIAAIAGQLRFPRRHDWPVVLSIGLVQMGTFMGLVNFALQYVPAGRSAILTYTTPIWVVPMAMLLLAEKVSPKKWIGFILGIAGVLIMFNPLAFDWSNADVLRGNGIMVFTAFLWAMLIIHTRGHRWEGSPLSLAPWQFLIASLLLIPVVYWLEADREIVWSGKTALVMLYNGPLATAFCFWAMITITRALPAINTSLGMLGVPVVGVVSAALVLGEAVTTSNLAGLLLIGAGLIMLALADFSAKKVAN